jgi:tetratricopeptide (TPR) repeat protein
MTPAEVGRAIAAAQGRPVEVAAEAGAACSPRVHALRDAVVTVVCGVAPEEVGRVAAAAMEEATRQIRGEFERFRRGAGLTEAAARRVLEDLGERGVPTDQLPARLAGAVGRYHELLARLRTYEGEDPDVARLAGEARAAIERGDFDAAEAALQRARGTQAEINAARRQALDRGRLREAELLADQARLAGLRFRHAAAGRLYREAADLVPDSEPVQRANYLGRAGVALWAGGVPAEAEELERRALALRERALAADHPDVATSLDNLGATLSSLGRPAEAVPLHRRALAINLRAFGPEAPAVAASLNNLAAALGDLGRAAEATPMLRRVSAIYEAAFGPDDPRVAASLDHLAVMLRSLGRAAEAEPLHRRALAMRERILSPDHPFVGQSLGNLAWTLRVLGRPAEAEPLLRRALALWMRALGPEHPLTRSVRRDLEALRSTPVAPSSPTDPHPRVAP